MSGQICGTLFIQITLQMSVPHVLAGFVALELNKINITNVGATIFGWIRGT